MSASGGGSGWDPLLDDLSARRGRSEAMGGPERVARHHERGRLDARQRVARLVDPGSFVELGLLVGGQPDDAPEVPADALVAGSGTIDGRPVVVGVEDFTVLGGSIGDGAADKRYRLTQLAAQERVPLVMVLEGAGHRLTNTHAGRRPNDLQGLAELSGRVPLVAVVCGASAGHGALTAPLADFAVMTEQASLFSAGPPLVEAAIGEQVSKEDLGGPQVHVDVSGVAHNRAPGDAAALDLARRYLGYFPSSAWRAPPVRGDGDGDDADRGPRRLEAILDLVPPDPRRPYSMRAVVDLLADSGSVLEVQPSYGASMVCALAFLGGRSVAIVANDPAVRAGTIDTPAAEKAARFVEVAGAFHLPVVFLADNPGVMVGTRAEQAGALRSAARLFAAQHRLAGPKLHVTLRKAFGFGSSVMAMNPFDGQTVSLAFPAITLGAMPAGSGSDAAGLDDASRAVAAAREAGGAFPSAHRLSYDDVIDPRDLRDRLLAALGLTADRMAGPFEPVGHPGILP